MCLFRPQDHTQFLSGKMLVLPITLFLSKCSSSLLGLSTAAKSNGNIPVLLSYPWQSSSVLVPRKKPTQLYLSQLSLKHSHKLSSGQHQILSRNTSTQTHLTPILTYHSEEKQSFISNFSCSKFSTLHSFM